MLLPSLLCLVAGATPLADLMPEPADYSLMYWADGWPGNSPNAPWRRVIQTGRYAFVLDTETLQVPHYGPLPPGLDYRAAALADNRAWASLPRPELLLSMVVRRPEPTAARAARRGPVRRAAADRVGRLRQRGT